MIAMKWITALLLAGALLIHSGCSTKKYFSPEKVDGDLQAVGSVDGALIDNGLDGAVLQNGTLLGNADRHLPEGFRYIGQSDGWLIAGAISGELLMQSLSEDRNITLPLKKTVAAATAKGDKLAVLFANNDMGFYSLSTKELLHKERGTPAVAVDSRIVNPYFLNELTLFLTLDGKIVIINSETYQKLRSMLVGADETTSNVIYFNVIDNTIVAATGETLFLFEGREIREKYDLRDIVFDKEGIWIATKQGELVALNEKLELKSKMKFPFAHFLGLVVTDKKLYALEKEGYMIEADKQMSGHKVYRVDMEEGFVHIDGSRFYFSVADHKDEFGNDYRQTYRNKTAYIDVE